MDEAKKIHLVSNYINEEFEQAAKKFNVNPSSTAWQTLEELMWARQGIGPGGSLNRPEIIEIVDTQPIVLWVSKLASKAKGE